VFVEAFDDEVVARIGALVASPRTPELTAE
jgi:hypothetical protein